MAHTSQERHNQSRSVAIILLALLLLAIWLFTHHHL